MSESKKVSKKGKEVKIKKNNRERGNHDGRNRRRNRKYGKPSKAKRAVLNRYNRAMKKRKAQREREAAAARGITFQLGDIVAPGGNYATEYSLCSQVKATRKATKAAVATRNISEAEVATANASLANASKGDREINP